MYGIYANIWDILMVNVAMIMAYIRIRHGYDPLISIEIRCDMIPWTQGAPRPGSGFAVLGALASRGGNMRGQNGGFGSINGGFSTGKSSINDRHGGF